MNPAKFFRAESRGLIEVGGRDARAFLQGIVSNDVNKASTARALYATFLTPQGKYLHDFFVAAIGSVLFIDCEADRRGDLVRRLQRFKLRAEVALAATTADWEVHIVYGAAAAGSFALPAEPGIARSFAGGIAFVDPRLVEAGVRTIIPVSATGELAKLGLERGGAAEYDALRLTLGLPDGSRDLEPEKSLLLEAGIDQLNGVDWDKGCYMGQELTARTRYRGLIRKRLIPVRIEGVPPAPGATIRVGGAEAGTMRSSAGGIGLALLRIEAIDGPGPLTADGARLTPSVPPWLKLARAE